MSIAAKKKLEYIIFKEISFIIATKVVKSLQVYLQRHARPLLRKI